MKLYMAVTADRYELPVFLAGSLKELGAKYSMTGRCINSYIYRGTVHRKEGVKFVKVKTDETATERRKKQ